MRKTHSPEQIIDILRQVERKTNQGKTVAEVCRARSISEWSFYRWRQKYGGMEKSDAKQLKELEKENARLKKLLAEKELDNDILKEALKTKFQRPVSGHGTVTHVQQALDVNERRACRALGQPRSTQQYRPRRVEKDKALVKRLHELALKHPRYGYRRITAKLNEEHWHVNRKRVQRLWRAEGLIPTMTHKRRRPGDGQNACHRHKPEHSHHVRALDFLMDTTLSGGRLEFLTILDEYSRACLSIKVARSMTGSDVKSELERLITLHGPPGFIRCDNGPEFIARATRRFLAETGVGTLFIDPGSPWQSQRSAEALPYGYSESFNGRLRNELLNLELFTSTLEARILSENWRCDYNEHRPHGALTFSLTHIPPGSGFWGHVNTSGTWKAKSGVA